VESLEDRVLLSPYLVTTTADTGAGSLRDAITQVNADTSHTLYASPGNPNVDEIDFAIGADPTIDPGPGYNSTTGVATITPQSALPGIGSALLINGYTQGQGTSLAASPNTLAAGDNAVLKVELNGSAFDSASNGANSPSLYPILALGNGVTVEGLVINRGIGVGVLIGGTGATLSGNFIGTDVSGTVAEGNTGANVYSYGNPATIGGMAPADRNVISGARSGADSSGLYGDGIREQGSNDVIEGNFIGTDASGARSLGNYNGIVAQFATNLTVGGMSAGAGNVISGNGTGISEGYSPGTVIQGNFIGTDASGTRITDGAGNPLNPGFSVGILASDGAEATIGGTMGTVSPLGTAGFAGNLISGNGTGIILGGSGNLVQGNDIGTDWTGEVALGNYNGLSLYGTAQRILGNVISGNSYRGIENDGSSGDVIQGNKFGTDPAGTQGARPGWWYNEYSGTVSPITGLGNSAAIFFIGGSNDQIGGLTTGAGNTIAYNGSGITVGSGTGNSILGNSIHDNGGLGINLDSSNNANDDQAAPVLTSASSSAGGTTISGTLASVANTTFRIEFFSNVSPNGSGFGEGLTFLGFTTVTTDASGNATFSASGLAPVPAGQAYLSATATNLTTNDTSAFAHDGVLAAVALASSANPSVFGQAMTLTATVSAYATGIGTPTGSVDFFDTTANTDLGTVALSGGTATLTASSLAVGAHTITVTYGGDGTFLASSGTLTQTVNKDGTVTALTSSVNPSVYGQAITLTAAVSASAPGAGTPTGSVDFYDTTTNTDLGTVALSGGTAQLSTAGLSAEGHTITATYSGDGNFLTSSGTLAQTVNPDPTTTAVTSSLSSAIPGQPITFTALVNATAPGAGTPTGSVDFYDTSTSTDLGSALLSAGQAALTTSALALGSHVIRASYLGDGNFLASSAALGQAVIVTQSIYVLNGTASGALSVTGNASINIPGTVYVDSSSPTALTESGNAAVTAASIQVVGGASQGGHATWSPAPVTGAASAPDPLAALAAPTTGIARGSVNLSGNSTLTINPGVYSSIQVSGNARLTLNPGVYVLAGGGLTVTGNASLSGSGVMLYNTQSNFPGTGGTFGGLTLSGNGTISLTAPTNGPYAGVVLFQNRGNTRAISLSGGAAQGLVGTVYAPAALLYLGGNASLQGAVVVNQLSLTGNAGSTQAVDSADVNGGDAAGQLLAGNLEVYVDNSSGLFTADELARIQDAVNAVDATVAPYGVSVSETTDPTAANVTIDTGATSAVGGYADGILGCYTSAGEVTLIQGWDWYAGTDPTLIGATQYDFQTTLTHELGHALGLGESADPTSAMYGTLAPGTAIRTLTTADLAIPYADGNADAQRAAPASSVGSLAPVVSPSAGEGLAAGLTLAGPVAVTPPVATALVRPLALSAGPELLPAGAARLLTADGTAPATRAADRQAVGGESPPAAQEALPSPGTILGGARGPARPPWAEEVPRALLARDWLFAEAGDDGSTPAGLTDPTDAAPGMDGEVLPGAAAPEEQDAG
jgi:hypothetical protein